MKLLLDTHVLLWAASDPDQLSAAARSAVESGDNEVFASTVSAWEIAIKQSIGKLDLPRPAEQWLPDVIRKSGFDVAVPDLAASLRVRGLPWHHRDPFDRLLIAQALECGLTLVTREDFAAYGIASLRA